MRQICANSLPMTQVRSFTFNPFMENTYVVYDDSQEAVIIDPGCYESHEKQELLDFISANQLKVKYLLNTHGHIDHVLGNAFVKEKLGLSLWIGEKDLETLKSVEVYAPNYGFQGYQAAEPDHFLKEGDQVTFGSTTFKVLYVPGHAPGHIAFYCEAAGFCIGGDVLFQRSIGRTDLPGGDFDTLIQSIHNKFFTLPDDTVIHSGHGPNTTIGEEKRANPFCAIG